MLMHGVWVIPAHLRLGNRLRAQRRCRACLVQFAPAGLGRRLGRRLSLLGDQPLGALVSANGEHGEQTSITLTDCTRARYPPTGVGLLTAAAGRVPPLGSMPACGSMPGSMPATEGRAAPPLIAGLSPRVHDGRRRLRPPAPAPVSQPRKTCTHVTPGRTASP